MVSKSKHVAGSGKEPGISNVRPLHTRESVLGKLPRVSNVEVSSNDPSSSRIQRRPSTIVSLVKIFLLQGGLLLLAYQVNMLQLQGGLLLLASLANVL